MDLEQYVRVLRAHWLLVLLSVAVCSAGAAAVAWTRTPVYAAQMQLFVSTAGAPADLSQTYQGGLFSQQRVRSYAEVLSSPEVTRAVINQLGLHDSVQHVQGEIRTSVPADTVLINVTVKDRSRRRAKAIANALGAQFPNFVSTLETPQSGRSSPVKVSVTRQAQLPGGPDSPHKTVYLVLGVLLGLVLGIAGAVLREAFDRRVRDEDEAAAITGAPVIGTIPEDPLAESRPLVVVSDPFSVRSEAYRRLRTNLRALSVDHGIRSFVVTSAVESEGKTVIVANLGVALAQAGLRVVLVDTDLRRPKLAEVLGLSPSLGLTNVLVSKSPLEVELQKYGDGLQLEVLGSGPQVSMPNELLGRNRFAAVLDVLTRGADAVILDTPALLPLTDAAILARVLRGSPEQHQSSGVILVARAGSTRADELAAATESLRAINEQVVGVVLNRSPARHARPYGSLAEAAERPSAALARSGPTPA
jgi:polysaccharide biosynthesis transport protein